MRHDLCPSAQPYCHACTAIEALAAMTAMRRTSLVLSRAACLVHSYIRANITVLTIMNGGSTCDVLGLGPDNPLLEVIHPHHPFAPPLGHLDCHLLLLLLGGSSGLLLHHLPAHAASSSRLQNSMQVLSMMPHCRFSAVPLSHLLLCGF